MTQGYEPLPEIEPNSENHRRRMARRLNDFNEGKFNCTMAVTLTANATTTTITDARIYATSWLGFMPTTATAAAALTAMYVTDRIKGSCTLNHDNTADTDRTFVGVVLS